MPIPHRRAAKGKFSEKDIDQAIYGVGYEDFTTAYSSILAAVRYFPSYLPIST
jgi:hypothetical protein